MARWWFAITVLSVAMSGRAHGDAAVSGQPWSPLWPNHDRYGYGRPDRPYAVTFDAGSDPRAVDDVHVFEPVRGHLPIRAAPVVVLFHGYGMDAPDTMGAFIQHLTRRGMTAVYPAFLDLRPGGNPYGFADWVERSADAIGRALALLDSPGHVRPLRDRRGEPVVAFVAHSVGSYVAAFVAERGAVDPGLPAPRTIVMADPAGHDVVAQLGVVMDRPWTLEPQTELVMLSAEGTLAGSNARGAVEDFLAYLPIDCRRRSAWLVPHDAEQGAALVSDHLGFLDRHPTNPAVRLDAIDWWGYWLHATAHLEHAFHGTYGAFRHGGSLYSGLWLDATTGQPLRFVAWKRPHPSAPAGHGCAAPAP